MSDLVEKVAQRLAGKYLTPSEGTYDTARDVIKAVAEWLEKDCGDEWFKSRHLLAQLKEGSE